MLIKPIQLKCIRFLEHNTFVNLYLYHKGIILNLKLTTDNAVLIIVKILQSRDIFMEDTGPRSSILNTIFSLHRVLDVTIISVISPE